MGKYDEWRRLPDFDDMATGFDFLKNFGQGPGEMIEDLADALVACTHPDQGWPGGVERGEVSKILILADDDPATGASKLPDFAITGLGEIEGPEVVALHSVSPEQRRQSGRQLIVEQKSQATRTTALPVWAAA